MQGLVEPNSRGLGERENKWSSSGGLVLLLLILVFALLVSSWIHTRMGHRHSCQRPSHPAVHLTSRGRARWVGGRRWRLSRRRQSSKRVSFLFPLKSFWETKPCLFSWCSFLLLDSAEYACSQEGAHTMLPRFIFDRCPKEWAYREKGWQMNCKTKISPFYGRLFLVSKRTFFFIGRVLVWMLHVRRV